MKAGAARLVAAYRARAWPTVLLFAVLSTAATVTSSTGLYVGDNRFEQYWNPARRVARSMTIWDAFRGLGRVREDFWPGTTLPIGLFRSIGTAPWLAERLWHALLLTLVGVGVAEVVRLFRPQRGMEHLIAGLAAAFGAYSATFLTPFSNLYFQFVVGIWLVVVFVRGLRSDHPWRWAAAMALLVLTPGDVDTPGLVYNMIPLVWVSVYLLLVERSVRLERYLGFLARAAVLTLAVNAAVLAKVYLGAATFGQRLNDTEAAEVSFLTSSWPESIRGLGNWLSYFRDEGNLLKPQGAPHFNNWVVVVATFVPVVFALMVPWLSRWRPRILFSMMALGSLVVLVGAYPLYEPSPLGEQVYRAFDQIPMLAAFRNTYKIGSGLVIGVSAMFGYAVAASYRRVKRLDRHLAYVPVLLAAFGILGAGFPFWTGQLYNPNQTMEAVPQYWSDATEWLDAQPGDGRVLVVPPTSRSRYRWGWVGDDIFDSLLARPHAVATGVPLTTPETANLLEAISFGASDRTYVTGTLAPIARRLGIEYVVIRNDLDWQDLGRPRPAEYSRLRADPELEPVATFGAPGEFTTAPDDTGPIADEERTLPPVEVYRIGGVDGSIVRLVADQPSLLVSGDGWAYPSLAQSSLLPDGGPPVEYTASLEPDQLAERLEAGSPLVITDTNRRRLRVMLSYEPDYSHTLADGEELDRAPRTLFGDETAESVAWFPDADAIKLSGAQRSVSGSRPWSRPSNAFDGDPATQVVLRRSDGVSGRALRVDFREAETINQMHIDVANVVGTNDGITRAEVAFSDGTVEQIDLTKGALDGPFPVRSVDVEFPARTTDFVEVRLSGIAGTARQFGIADISFPGIDLTEYVEAPDDVLRASRADERVAAALENTPTAYLMRRWLGYGEASEETALRRRIEILRTDTYTVGGTLRYTTGTTDALLDAILGRPVGATSDRRAEGAPERGATFAVDGDLSTAWTASARVGETMRVRLPEREVGSVTLTTPTTTGVPVQRWEATIGDQVVDLVPEQVTPCPGGAPDSSCWVASASFAPVRTDRVDVRVADLENPTAGLGGGRVSLAEITLDGAPNEPLPADDTALAGCHDIGIRITGPDGVERAVPVFVDGTVGALRAGESLAYRSCEDLDLTAGPHLIDSGPDTGIDELRVDTARLPVQVGGRDAPGAAAVDWQSPTRIEVEADTDGPATLILEQGYAKGWVAGSGGGPADQAVMLDTLSGWRLEDVDSAETVELRYRGQLIFGLSLVVTAIGLLTCVVIFVVPPGAPWRRRPEERS